MIMKKGLIIMVPLLTILVTGCGERRPSAEKRAFTGVPGEVKLITLDPGHFHAALVQKSMYEQIDPVVRVYAPEGEEVKDHLARIEAYNQRVADPTAWVEEVYAGDDYLERMLTEKPGNVVVLAGNNARKTEYILKAVEAGLNVLADKPMVITPENFTVLEKAFSVASEKEVLLYDIMTERYEITTILQKELSLDKAVFGELQKGTPEEPAITKESVHHFSKIVSGTPLKRPPWFFDTTQQGEGIVDVTTHLVDLIQWEAFPELILKKEDVELHAARRWSTDMTPEMFSRVTGLSGFPEYLGKYVKDNLLKVYSNGELDYSLKGIRARVSVIWNFEAPEGTGDTHYSIMRGTRCNLVINQGREQNYKPVLYIEQTANCTPAEFEAAVTSAISRFAGLYPGLSVSQEGEKVWRVEIPEEFKVGHEAHFAQVTGKYLQYLVDGKLPEWEVPNMLVKYYTTTEALKLASRQNQTMGDSVTGEAF